MINANDVLNALLKHTNVLLYGQPGTGKSHLMKAVENLFLARFSGDADRSIAIETGAEREAIVEQAVASGHSRWVTFHQGYSYEDFIIGLRPSMGATTTALLSLEARPGALLQLAATARDGSGLMLIDEINRGNASRIFGEFITLMETDKRLNSDGTTAPSTVTVTLPYLNPGDQMEVAPGQVIEAQFRMPRNIYTLASMNSVDKSVAPLDAAIRRRFHVIHMRPELSDLRTAAGLAAGVTHAVAELAVEVMLRVNHGIGLYLGPDYMLGQYYLPANPTLAAMSEADAKVELVNLWRHKILPQLLELLQGRAGVLAAILGDTDTVGASGIKLVEPTDGEVDLGASPYVVNTAESASDDDIFGFLRGFGAPRDTSDASDNHLPSE